MATINYDADNSGMNIMRAVGRQMRVLTGKATMSDSYTTGGEDFDVSAFFAKETIAVLPANSGGYTFEYDHDNKKLLAYEAGVEVTAATDLSSVVVPFVAFGY